LQTLREYEQRCKYLPSHVVAKKIGISGLALSRMTASLYLHISSEQRTNIGLNLKFESKGLKVIGYSRKSARGWEFSEDAVNLIVSYKGAFPELFARLDHCIRKDSTDINDYFEPENAIETVQRVKEWLKKNASESLLERVPLDSEMLDKNAIQNIEKEVDSMLMSLGATKPLEVRNIPPTALLKPEHACFRLNTQNFSLGERVVYVQDAGNVPIAALGTVVGISQRQTQIDVVFDQTFMSGNSLRERCSAYRGMTVASYSLLNLTNQQLITATPVTAPNSPSSKQAIPASVRSRGLNVHATPFTQKQMATRGRPPYMETAQHSRSIPAYSRGRGNYNTNGYSDAFNENSYRGRGRPRGRGYSRGY